MNRRALLSVAIVIGVLASATVAVAASPTRSTSATRAPLQVIRQDLDHWLVSFGLKGFYVAEVMAFSNNDYVAVNDAAGKPAFELLVSPQSTWVMEEPPSMMWNTKYGMFGHLRGSVQPLPGFGMMMGGGAMMGSGPRWFGSGARQGDLARAGGHRRERVARRGTNGRDRRARRASLPRLLHARHYPERQDSGCSR